MKDRITDAQFAAEMRAEALRLDARALASSARSAYPVRSLQPMAVCSHLPTCGRGCPGEPACSETADVVCGATDDQLRAKYGPMALDVPCEHVGCEATAGSPCLDERTGRPMQHPRSHHGERAIAAVRARHAAGWPTPGWSP